MQDPGFAYLMVSTYASVIYQVGLRDSSKRLAAAKNEHHRASGEMARQHAVRKRDRETIKLDGTMGK